jgi:hypothetical protein
MITPIRRASFLAILVATAAVLPLRSSPREDAARLRRDNRLLEEEFALAKAPSFYFMFNLADRTIALKSKGIVLRSWTAKGIRYWGKPVKFRALTLARKTALTPPKRKVIKPGESETVPTPAKPGEFVLEALEVKDMPLTYSLELDDGTRIDISPVNKGLAGFVDDFRWSIGLPLASLKQSFRKKATTTIGISFADPKDGQALYWALTEGLKGLVWLPQD